MSRAHCFAQIIVIGKPCSWLDLIAPNRIERRIDLIGKPIAILVGPWSDFGGVAAGGQAELFFRQTADAALVKPICMCQHERPG